MVGDFDSKQQEFQKFLKNHAILPASEKIAIDLGAGHGIPSVPLAKLGFKVTAIDFNRRLLDELKINGKDLDIEVIEDDIRSVTRYSDLKPAVIICWGDTLTHLDNLMEVEQLLADCCGVLDQNGKLILSFRDYTHELTGDSRFIPVKSDDNRILTCILEYGQDHVRVTDLLYEKQENEWKQKVSSYCKIRIPAAFVKNCLEQHHVQIILENSVNGMVTLIGLKR